MWSRKEKLAFGALSALVLSGVGVLVYFMWIKHGQLLKLKSRSRSPGYDSDLIDQYYAEIARINDLIYTAGKTSEAKSELTKEGFLDKAVSLRTQILDGVTTGKAADRSLVQLVNICDYGWKQFNSLECQKLMLQVTKHMKKHDHPNFQKYKELQLGLDYLDFVKRNNIDVTQVENPRLNIPIRGWGGYYVDYNDMTNQLSANILTMGMGYLKNYGPVFSDDQNDLSECSNQLSVLYNIILYQNGDLRSNFEDFRGLRTIVQKLIDNGCITGTAAYMVMAILHDYHIVNDRFWFTYKGTPVPIPSRLTNVLN